jgi:hypothetical protein
MSNIDSNLIAENEWGYSFDDYWELKDQEMRERMEAFEEVREITGKQIVEIDYSEIEIF